MILRTLSLDALKRWMGEKAKGGKKLKKERKHWDYFPSKKKNSKPIILRHRVEMLSQLKTVFFSLCVYVLLFLIKWARESRCFELIKLVISFTRFFFSFFWFLSTFFSFGNCSSMYDRLLFECFLASCVRFVIPSFCLTGGIYKSQFLSFLFSSFIFV